MAGRSRPSRTSRTALPLKPWSHGWSRTALPLKPWRPGGARTALVKGFRLDLVQRSNNKQTGPLFDQYLPSGLRAVTEAEMATAEPAAVTEILRKLEASGGELDTTWRPRLVAALEPVTTEATARHGVETRQRDIEAQIDARLTLLQQARVELHAGLRTHYKAAPAWAEDDFYRWHHRRSRSTSSTTTTDATS